ncbi:DUF3667 domain-containing protein [bacterium SCSIO 12741]|nr:DUF3667 domain-containing protein [bacterium SCSIO 12741]
METCQNCGAENPGRYCSVCGQKVLPRITLKYIIDNTSGHILSYDNSFLHTVFALIIRPGVVLTEFMEGKRAHYFEPFKFLLLTITLTSIAFIGLPGMDSIWDIQAQQAGPSININGNEAGKLFQKMLRQYFTIFLFLTIPTGAIINSLLFRKLKYNLAEHLVVITYITGITNLINIPMYLLTFLDRKIFMITAIVWSTFPYIYSLWYYIKVYKENVFVSLIKIILASTINLIIYAFTLGGMFLLYYKFFK